MVNHANMRTYPTNTTYYPHFFSDDFCGWPLRRTRGGYTLAVRFRPLCRRGKGDHQKRRKKNSRLISSRSDSGMFGRAAAGAKASMAPGMLVTGGVAAAV